MNTIIVSVIILASLSGFSVASYIHTKKKAKKKLICPMKSNCDTVTHSDHSKIVGIKVELLGMIYYAFIASVYSFVLFSCLWSEIFGIVLFGLSGASFLFSLYLISLQAFVIRQWCSWCLFSALMCTIIFGLSYLHVVVG
jgi:uncharacterized membrane protein